MFDSRTTLAWSQDEHGVPAAVCKDCAVRQDSLCGTLGDQDLSALHKLGRRRHLHRGEAIAWAGEESRDCANILSGILKVSALTHDGREQIVGLLYPSDFVGQPFMGSFDFTVTALGDAEVCIFPRSDFERFLSTRNHLTQALLRRTFDTLSDARKRMLLLGRQSASERIADFLLQMLDRTGGCSASAGGPVTFDLPLSRGAIADVLGLTIETVSRQMTKLKIAGVIGLPGGRTVTIVKREELRHVANAA
ncbi:Crp/Fnr family transcriptional regulator (plasmid) [Sphingomonas panacis]|uniref:Crp/Fnr family transcriptional regulator n=1 Tax=Sphingomonas panacis TaxID=1560345 RepID=A0A1B3ZHZ6_9SPHN|nr:helix-turn-helix domain-containing protein [Sphingomonas panacis]AOH87045.1 Crp/Fnr family transcriptional regulator [Sphingomonas panacis]